MNNFAKCFTIFLCLTALPLFAEKESVELLSEHQFTASFEGVAYKKCFGRTARCPDKCGKSGNFATFKVIQYQKYNKPGKYGDAKYKQYRVKIEDGTDIAKFVKDLKDNDKIALTVHHNYVTKNKSKSPRRDIVSYKKI